MTPLTQRLPVDGFVDNASALPTTPPTHHQQGRRTFDLSYPTDIFTRHGHSRPHRSLCRALIFLLKLSFLLKRR